MTIKNNPIQNLKIYFLTQITNYDTCTLSRCELQLSRFSFKGTPCYGAMESKNWQALVVGWACMLPSWYQVCHNVSKHKVFICNERRWYIWKWCWIVKMSMILGKRWRLFDRTHFLGFVALSYRPILGPST